MKKWNDGYNCVPVLLPVMFLATLCHIINLTV